MMRPRINNRFHIIFTALFVLFFSTQPAYAQTGTHTVKPGESLSTIAQSYGLSTNELAALNGISNYDLVRIGQELIVSAATVSSTPAVASTIHIVQAGDTLSTIAESYNLSTQSLMAANGLPNANFVWTGQRLRIPGAGGSVNSGSFINALSTTDSWPGTINGGSKLIEVNLSTQSLIAWNAGVPVMQTSISSGLSATPTVVGRYLVDRKYPSQDMYGPGYNLKGVPWVMYFWEGYAFHGAYWHNNFGMPMSHGCVNMRPDEAGVLYEWADMGTEVYVHY